MSLLMEALRKAEEAKRKSQEQEPQQSVQAKPVSESLNTASNKANEQPSQTFSLEPLEQTAPVAEPEVVSETAPEEEIQTESPAPKIEDELQEYFSSDSIIDEAEPPPRARVSGNKPSRDQQAAAAVFAAKQNSKKKGSNLSALIISFFVLVSAGGATLWYLAEYSSSKVSVNQSIANYNLESRGFIDEAVSTVASPEPELAPETPLAPTAEDIAALEERARLLEAESIALTESNLADAASENDLDQVSVEDPADKALSTSSRNVLQISRSSNKQTVNSTLQSAYNTLQTGDMNTATQLYQQALQVLPNNTDALLGLASIYSRTGQIAQARPLYARVLQLNPQNPYARAGLLQAIQNNNPALENELKALLANYSELAPLHFALGNFYAANQRWSEAQGAYFDALLYANRNQNDQTSPDYAFNLAVSLEQLQQPSAALTYYKQAQEMALTRPAGFNQSQLSNRLALLEQSNP